MKTAFLPDMKCIDNVNAIHVSWSLVDSCERYLPRNARNDKAAQFYWPLLDRSTAPAEINTPSGQYWVIPAWRGTCIAVLATNEPFWPRRPPNLRNKIILAFSAC